ADESGGACEEDAHGGDGRSRPRMIIPGWWVLRRRGGAAVLHRGRGLAARGRGRGCRGLPTGRTRQAPLRGRGAVRERPSRRRRRPAWRWPRRVSVRVGIGRATG